MNQGLYGVASGQGASGRKLAAHSRSGVNYQINLGTAANSAGTSSQIAAGSLVAGARTRIFSATGRGALRWFGAGPVGGITDMTVEVVIDGVVVSRQTRAAAADGSGLFVCGVGGAATWTSIWDYMPFDASCEVFATFGTTTNGQYAYIIDLHQ